MTTTDPMNSVASAIMCGTVPHLGTSACTRPSTPDFTLDPLTVEYMTRYVPTIPLDDDFKFQEESRILDAHEYPTNEQDAILGWNAYHIIRRLLAQRAITEPFRTFIHEELAKVPAYPANIRATIKRVWMYPTFKYTPWNVIDAPVIVELANEIGTHLTPRFELVLGKVYATFTGLKKTLAQGVDLTHIGDLRQLVPNFETEHITIVNSDKVALCDPAKLADLLAQYNRHPIDLHFTEVAHTISLDWQRFSICVVIKLHSQAIDAFVKEFNDTFHLPIRPEPHTTIAILPR